jgi:putative tricarboxylic transport membrane protein
MVGRIGLATGELIVGLAFIALGAYVFATASGMPMGVPSLPGPGVLPCVIGILLVVAGALIVVSSRRRRAAGGEEPSLGFGHGVEFGHVNVLIGMGCLFLAIFLFEVAGAPAVFAVMLTVLFKSFADTSWLRSAIGGVVGSGIAWLVFVRLLEVQLPFGFWV